MKKFVILLIWAAFTGMAAFADWSSVTTGTYFFESNGAINESNICYVLQDKTKRLK